MGKMVTGLLVVLLLHGLSANQGLEDLSNPTARENNISLNMNKFFARGKRVFPVQPGQAHPWKLDGVGPFNNRPSTD